MKILIGFQTETGSPVNMELHHLAIFGMTQLSGKTTALEAFISRSGLMAIAFRTKRGETGFTRFNQIPPYYRPRADWQYLESLIDAALHERVKFEPGMRGAIMRVTGGSKDLEEVQERCEEQASTTKGAFMRDVFAKLSEYLKLIVPEIRRHTFSDRILLSKGVNVMDLTAMRRETQGLVIASTMDFVMDKMKDVVVVVPEAWEHLPQSRRTPVSLSAEAFIRKGAAIGNYLWIDSQDIGGVDKGVLRQVDNWLLGRMKEAHEVERVLKQLLGVKIKPEEIQTLGLGHFYAAIGNKVYKVYVLPSSVPEEAGRQVAMGKLAPEEIRERYIKHVAEEGEDLVWKERCEEAQRKIRQLEEELTEARAINDINLAKEKAEAEKVQKQLESMEEKLARFQDLENALRNLLSDQEGIPPRPVIFSSREVELAEAETQILLKPAGVQTVHLSAVEGIPGKVLQVVIEDEWAKDQRQFTFSEISKSLKERGWDPGPANINNAIKTLKGMGIFIQVGEKGRCRLPSKLKIVRGD